MLPCVLLDKPISTYIYCFDCGSCHRQCYLGDDNVLGLSQAVTPVKALLLRGRVPSLSKIKYFFSVLRFYVYINLF